MTMRARTHAWESRSIKNITGISLFIFLIILSNFCIGFTHSDTIEKRRFHARPNAFS